jgi:hypothetical protein
MRCARERAWSLARCVAKGVLLGTIVVAGAPRTASAQYTLPKRDSRVGFPRWGGCFGNITVGGPQRMAVDWAYGRESRPAGAGPKTEDLQCSWASARVGFGAGALGVGYHRYFGPLGTMLFGQVAVLRTFDKPNGGTPNMTYVGIEGGGSYLVGISPRVGYFVRTGGGNAPRGMFTWGVGFGF